MIDDALAPHLGRVGGQNRRDQRLVEQFQHRLLVYTLAGEQFYRLDHGRAFFGCDALTIFGQIGEQRKQHESAHKGQRFIERQGIQTGIYRIRIGETAVAIDAGRPDIFGASVQLLAAIRTNDIAEQFAEIFDVRILADGEGFCHGPVLHRDRVLVKKFCALARIMSGVIYG